MMTESNGNPPRPTSGAERARWIVEAYGADPARWPPKERAALNARIQSSPDLAADLAQAQKLDALLDGLPGAVPSAGLVGRVMTGAPTSAAQQGFSVIGWLSGLWPQEPVWRPSAALAFSALVGVALASFVYWPTAGHNDETESTQGFPLALAGIGELAGDQGAGESRSALGLVFDPAGINVAPVYSNAYENSWDLAFDPAGIELAGFTMNGR